MLPPTIAADWSALILEKNSKRSQTTAKLFASTLTTPNFIKIAVTLVLLWEISNEL
jgi:hypothetical protein